MREPAKVVRSFLEGLADDRHVQAAADHASDIAERHTLFGGAVIAGASGTFLKHKPEEMGSIEPMHRRPLVEPFAQMGRDTLLACDADEDRNEAVIAIAMYGWRQAHH